MTMDGISFQQTNPQPSLETQSVQVVFSSCIGFGFRTSLSMITILLIQNQTYLETWKAVKRVRRMELEMNFFNFQGPKMNE